MEGQINFSQMLLCKVEIWKWICHIYFYKMLIFIFHFPNTQSCDFGIQASKAKHWGHIDSVFYCVVLGHEGEILFLFGSFLFQFKFLSSNLGNKNPIIWSYNDSSGSFASFCQLAWGLQQGIQDFAPVNKESMTLRYTSWLRKVQFLHELRWLHFINFELSKGQS